MATPNPMSDTRNCTMNETSVKRARPLMMRSVDGIATMAMSSGTRARNDANTNASTRRAPTPPISTSTSRLGPLLLPALPDSSAMPVSWMGWPATVAESSAAVILGYDTGFRSKPGMTGA